VKSCTDPRVAVKGAEHKNVQALIKSEWPELVSELPPKER